MRIRRANRVLLAACSLLLAVAGLSVLADTAAAQGLFGFLFGQRPSYSSYPRYPAYPSYQGYPQSPPNAYAEPGYPDAEFDERRSGGERGPYATYCVRLCDGRYFPVPRNKAGAAEACNSLCPASETKIFAGSGIDNASATDGTHYSDIENAFVYRKRIVAGCTCNGKNAFGLAHIDVNEDPTLRKGDIVATTDGLLAFKGRRREVGEFTPVDPSRLTKAWRDSFAKLKVEPAREIPPNDAPPLRSQRQSRAEDAAAR
jgi:hypothetical protein